MCVVSDQAEAIGITAIPTPITDIESDLWYLHQFFLGDFLFLTSAGFNSPTGVEKSIDSKAMRKVNDGQDVVLVGQSDIVSGDGTTVMVAGRLLIKEH